MSAHRTVIVGGGIVGAVVFQRLSCNRGRDVMLIEKTRPGLGATGFSGGILRVFHLDLLLAHQCLKGLTFYRDLMRTGEVGFHIKRTGFLTLVDAPHLEAARAAHAALSDDLDLQWYDAPEAAIRFGLASVAGLCGAIFEPDAGHVDPTQITRLLMTMGQSAGGVAMTGVELKGLRVESGGLRGITTNVGDIECEQLVLCTGAWTPSLAARIGLCPPVPMRSKTIQVNTFAIDRRAGDMPAFVDLGSQAYGRPDGSDNALVGCPVDEWDTDPEHMSPPMDIDRTEALARALPRWSWLADAQPIGGYRRQDAYDASGRGVVDWAPGVSGVLVATGFSGNGVKLAPSVADSVAVRLRSHAQHTESALPASHKSK